MEIIESS